MSLAVIVKAIGGKIPIIGQIISGIDDATPKLEDEVTVEVVGQPGARKQDLYNLALVTAYGLARPQRIARFLLPPPGLLMIEYDAADNWVRCTLRYKVGALSPGVGIGGISMLSQLPLIDGPPEAVIGVTPVFPLSIIGLPFLGRPFVDKTVLTTAGKVIDPNPTIKGSGGPIIDSPNPKPSGDNRSRGSVNDPSANIVSSYLIPMVFAALNDPGSQALTTFPQPTSGPLGG